MIIEMSLYSFCAFNLVYERSKNINTLMFANKISLKEYYIGKYIGDIVL